MTTRIPTGAPNAGQALRARQLQNPVVAPPAAPAAPPKTQPPPTTSEGQLSLQAQQRQLAQSQAAKDQAAYSGRQGQGLFGVTASAPPAPQTVARMPQEQFLHGQLQKLDQQLAAAPSGELHALRADLAAELARFQLAQAGQLSVPPGTAAVLARFSGGLPAAEAHLLLAKAAELVECGCSLETTSPPRFAANLALELSEYLAQGARPSPGLDAAFRTLVDEGQTVFAAKPALVQALQTNLAHAELNASIRDRTG